MNSLLINHQLETLSANQRLCVQCVYLREPSHANVWGLARPQSWPHFKSNYIILLIKDNSWNKALVHSNFKTCMWWQDGPLYVQWAFCCNYLSLSATKMTLRSSNREANTRMTCRTLRQLNRLSKSTCSSLESIGLLSSMTWCGKWEQQSQHGPNEIILRVHRL